MQVDVAVWAVSVSTRDGGGLRAQAFIKALQRLGIEVNIVGLGSTGPSTDRRASSFHRLKRVLFPVPLRFPVGRELARTTAPANHRLSLMSASHRWALAALESRWLDYPDLWSEFAALDAKHKNPLVAGGPLLQSALWRQREKREAARADVVTTASWLDSRGLKGAHWLPTPVMSRKELQIPRTNPRTLRTAGMLANFLYPPNQDAYQYLVSTWLPALRTSGIHVAVAGIGSHMLSPAPGVSLLGPVDSVNEFYHRVELVLAPIRLGGGMKVKVVEALAHGTPVLATGHATAGLPPRLANACIQWRDGLDSEGLMPGDPRSDQAVFEALDAYTHEAFDDCVGRLYEGAAE